MSRRWWIGEAVLIVVGVAAVLVHQLDRSTDRIQGDARTARLTIYSTTDLAEFEPIISDFQLTHPGITVNYVELDAAPLYWRFLKEQQAGERRADMLLSTAMDLQAKLVNDGYATPHYSTNAAALPSWARWRDEAFGITFEPAVMVFNTDAMKGRTLPQTRHELLDALHNDRDFWLGAVGTYDIVKSSVGYLLASQDARLSNEFSALLRAFGDVDVHTEDNTSTLLEELQRGQLKVGYNLLGSYARRLVEQGAPLKIVYPRDYTLAVLRTAVIPRSAPHPRYAHLFLEYLLSPRGQRMLETRTGLSAIREEVAQEPDGNRLSQARIGVLRPIALGPGLLTYLDTQKRRRLLEDWSSLINKPH